MFANLKPLLFLFILLSFLAKRADAGWDPISPTNLSTGKFNKIFASKDAKIICAIGNEGIISISRDAGVSWSSIQSQTKSNLYGGCFQDSLRGWIVGGIPSGEGTISANILFTTDGGISWNSKNSSADVFMDIKFTDDSTGWLMGYRLKGAWNQIGILMKTTDRGISWQEIYNTSDYFYRYKFYSMDFLDSKTGFAGSDWAPLDEAFQSGKNISFTKDGGATWSPLLIPNPDPYNFFTVKSICAKNLNEIYCVVESTQGSRPSDGIRFSTDSGASWSIVLSFSGLKKIVYADSSNLFAASDNIVLKSKNNFQSWDTVFIHKDITDILFVDNNHGFALTSKGILFTTYNGGTSWMSTNVGTTLGSSALLSKDIFMVSDIGGIIWKTLNGGAIWEGIKVPTISDINDIEFISENQGWVATRDGLFETTNGGDTWTKLSDKSFNTLTVVDNQLLLLTEPYNTGRNGLTSNIRVWHSADGGNTLSNVLEIEGMSFSSVSFVNDSNGYIVSYMGSGTYIHHTTDAGLSWQKINTDLDEILFYRTFFINDSIGWSIDIRKQETIWKTTNGGINWFNCFENVGGIKQLFFIDQNIGWACGNNGMIYKTVDGGQSIETINTHINESFVDIKFIDKLNGYAVGANGTVIKSVDGGISYIKDVRSSITHENLEQNYPNPFNPTTTIEYSIPSLTSVTLKVYDILGREVATLVNDEKPAGRYQVSFDGSKLSTGVYFYRIEAGVYRDSKKLLLIK